LKATIATQEISLSRRAVSGALQELVTREVLRPTNGGYVFTADLMRLWVQQYQRLEWVVGKISLPEGVRPLVRRGWVVGVAVAGLVLLTLFVIAWPNIRRWSAIIAPSETAISAEEQATQPTPTATPTTTTTPSAPTSEDNYESNDNFDEAYTLPVATSVTLEDLEGVTNFYPSGDEDWFKFLAKAGHWYQATTSELDGVDTYVEICDQNNSVMKRDDDGGGGYASQVKWEAQYDGYYYIRIININKVDTIGEYDLTVKEISAPATVTPRPSPTPDPDFDIAADSCEDNSDFDHACVIPPDAYHHFNFVPPYGGMDNDFFKLWVKPGLIYQCATSNLDYGVDPNMIMFSGPSWDDAIVSNDDFEPGNFNSRLAYYATYEGWLYLLVETGDRTPSDIYNSHYGLRCDMLLPPQPTATPTQPIPPPIPTFTPFSPSLGDAWIRPADGMVMVYVPAGEFEMGSDDDDVDYALQLCNEYRGDCEREWFEDEQQVHTVALDGFWIDQTEVTNIQYRQCVEAGACQAPTTCDLGEPTYGDASKVYHPVVCVSRYGAQTYCEWAGARLPTEAEWEYAARGPQGFIYPWGDDFDCSRGNFDDETQMDDYIVPGGEGCDGYERTAPVGSFPAGASWCNALDMAGNVWEWVADWYGGYPAGRQVNPTGPSYGEYGGLRGGSWDFAPSNVRSTDRAGFNPDDAKIYLGFRCARGSE
jgi:formylglycine-generating enzyme required for sulfatase activity